VDEPLIRDISDTARWVAVYRARETERPDAVFSDPFARALAGERGEQIARAMPFAEQNAWSFIARTFAVDRQIARAVEGGVDLVINLAAGLDARPYRMALPASIRWVEVDLPEILDYKADVLAPHAPRCALERVPLDLSNADARRGLFDRLGRTAAQVQSILKTAHTLKRLPLMLRMFAMLPESNGPQADRPWSGVVLLTRTVRTV